MNWDEMTPPDGSVRDWLAFRAAKTGGDTSHIFTDTDQTLTWARLHEEAKRVASHLTALGIGKGESVAIMLPNGYDGVTSLFGVLMGGFRTTVINLAAGAEAVGYALKHSEARFVILGEAQEELLKAARKLHPNDIKTLSPAIEAKDVALHEVTPQDHALLMYTSGTTGRPKGVVHSQKSLLAGGWTTAVAHRLDQQDRALCILPICHINGLCVTLMAPLVSGGSVVMAPKFSAKRFWEDCETHQTTWFSAVPTVISHLLHGVENPKESTKKRLRFGRSASAPLAPEIQHPFEERFGVEIVETMGLTETAAQILSNPLPPGPRKIGSPGIAFGNQVKILPSGEIAVKGPNVMLEYLKNEDATAQSFTSDNWLKTGDLGRMDEEGYVYVTGRLKELIIKGGENIAPREIDEALYSHGDVIEAAAFSRPCPSYGERVEAAVKIREGSEVTSENLIEICRTKLGAYKCPDRVFILNDLPKGPSGKIQRLKLGEMTSRS